MSCPRPETRLGRRPTVERDLTGAALWKTQLVRVQVASYRLGSGSTAELARRIEEGNVPVVRAVPGFVSYHAFEAGEGIVASVLVFESQSGIDEAERRLSGWIENTMDEFEVEPLAVLEGDVFASSA